MNNFEIGETVSWQSGSHTCIGIVYDDLGDEVELLCVEIGGKKAKHKLKVVKNLLERIAV